MYPNDSFSAPSAFQREPKDQTPDFIWIGGSFVAWVFVTLASLGLTAAEPLEQQLLWLASSMLWVVALLNTMIQAVSTGSIPVRLSNLLGWGQAIMFTVLFIGTLEVANPDGRAERFSDLFVGHAYPTSILTMLVVAAVMSAVCYWRVFGPQAQSESGYH